MAENQTKWQTSDTQGTQPCPTHKYGVACSYNVKKGRTRVKHKEVEHATLKLRVHFARKVGVKLSRMGALT